nr:AsnC family protein [Rhodococcus wratislaviensis]
MMQNEAVLDEIDYQIAHALQIAPRAPWGAVSEALQVSPVTASRRWDRLVQDGVAWVIA